MPGTFRIFDTIDAVDLAAWERVRSASAASIFMDPRFIAAVETGLKRDCRFWYVVGNDDAGRPAACAALCAMTIDLAAVAGPRVAALIRRIPPRLSRLRQLKALFCGLPGSLGEKSLALAATDAAPRLLGLLDEAIRDLASRAGMDVIVYKEFGEGELPRMNALLELGYTRIPTQPMHFFPASFPDFAHYCAALSTGYRKTINRSMKKLEPAGVAISILTEPEEILRVYTPEVHALYYQMVDKAEVNIELLPIEFFQELAVRLKGAVELIALSKDTRVIAIGWCLHDAPSYHMMYAGLDYQLNRELDLYFNLMYAALDRALRKRASRIHVGQTATAFKARLGCYSEPMYGFISGRGPVMSLLVRHAANLVLAEEPANPPADVFKKESKPS